MIKVLEHVTADRAVVEVWVDLAAHEPVIEVYIGHESFRFTQIEAAIFGKALSEARLILMIV